MLWGMEHIILYNIDERKILLKTAHDAIAYGIGHNANMPVDLSLYHASLLETGACFVTLHLNNNLRGCIGSLQAHQPLIVDVANNAFNAAFRDPRFKPVTNLEFINLQLEISVLSKPTSMYFSSEDNLLQQLRPGIDGLILKDQGHRGTFLPSVWQQFPDPKTFLSHLKNKSGLEATYWSNTLTIERYTAELIS